MTIRARNARVRLAAFVSSPIIILIAAGALTVDWLALNDDALNHSVAARWHGLRNGRGSALHGHALPVRFGRGPDGIRACSSFGEGDRYTADVQPLYVYVFRELPQRYGWWGLTREVRRLTILDPEGQLTSQEVTRLPSIAATFLVEQKLMDDDTHEPTLDMLRSGTLTRSRVLVAGYIHNCIAILLVLTISLGAPLWLTRLYRQARSDRWRKQGKCAACGFARAGLTHSRCPECGHEHETNS